MPTNKITWPWLGGFFQAEGSIPTPYNLTIAQKDKEPLDMIYDFLVHELPNTSFTPTYGPYKNKGKGIYYLNIRKGFKKVLTNLYPYLRDEKLIYAHLYLTTRPSTLPINDEWIVGFWEGDGSIQTGSRNLLVFSQKNPNVLNEIQEHLKYGKVRLHTNNNSYLHKLAISINKNNAQRIGELLSLVRTPPRLEQLKRVLS